MRVIEAYTEDTVVLGGRTLPRSGVVEDDDGFRILLTPDGNVPAREWAKAHAAGVTLLYLWGAEPCAWVEAETFIERRTENVYTGAYELEDRWWTPTGDLVGYRDLLQDARFTALITDGSESPQYVHLHLHTEYSPIDGLQTTKEAGQRIAETGAPAAAMTEHGYVSGHPAWQRAGEEFGFNPIFGLEGYFVPDRLVKGESQYDYSHLILLAADDEGLRNLWALSTASFASGFHGKPRLDWDLLQRHHSGLLVTTACLSGPLSQDLLEGREDAATATLARLGDIFGDRLYLELQTVQLEEQKRLNEALIRLGTQHGVPLIVSSDAHYSRPEDKPAHKAWLSVSTNKEDGDGYFSDEQYDHVQDYEEARKSLSYLPDDVVTAALANTVSAADRCHATIGGASKPPVYHKPTAQHPDPIRHDEDVLFEKCFEAFRRRTSGKSKPAEEYIARMEREMRLLIQKGFCGYFLMVADQTQHAKQNRVLVGPGRGSGGGSLVAYLTGITEIDPVESDLLFERFMTEGRVALPDFDVDYPSTKKQFMFDYSRNKYGADYVAIVGTHLRLKNKGIVRDVARAMKDSLPEDHYLDIDKVSKIIHQAEASTAGLGLPWDELWIHHEPELGPYREKYPDLFAMCDRLVGRLKTYAKHAAGVIISTDEPLTGTLPLRLGDEDEGAALVTQFEMNDLEALGKVKFDLLNLRTLDTIQMAVDLIEERTGYRVNVYDWLEEYEDPQVWEEIGRGRTLGIFQIETSSGTRLVKQFKPRSVADLADAITLVRPGPKNSGLTETYMKRRAGEEPVTFPEPRLEQVLGKTYGCMLYQEDIMQVCIVLAGYDGNEADGVRKILGKKQVEKVAKAGEEFIRRAVENGTERVVAEHLWEQMAEFAKYSFNRAHAFAYAILGYWTAWLKFHYPIEFLTAALSTVDQKRVPDFIGEARRMGYSVQPPDINESGRGFTAGQMSVRYGLEAIKGVGPAACEAIVAGQPYASWEDFLERKGDCDMGVVRTLAKIGAFDSLVPNRRGLETMLAAEKDGTATQCVFKNPLLRIGENALPCTFDWGNEPVEIGRSGKPKKRKPLPKKCTKACRQYTAPPPMDPANVEPYTDEDIREIEMELLGVYLSSTPFERIDKQWREQFLVTAEDVLDGPSGSYFVGAIIKGVRKTRTRAGNDMAFLTLTTERGDIDCAVFDEYRQYASHFTKGQLCVVEMHKNDRGQTLSHFMPL